MWICSAAYQCICHQERPLEINIHCFSIALPCIQHNMVMVPLRYPSAQSSSRHPIVSTMCCSTPCMVSMYLIISPQQPQVLLWLNGLVGRWMLCYQEHLRSRSIHMKFPTGKLGSKASGTMRIMISSHVTGRLWCWNSSKFHYLPSAPSSIARHPPCALWFWRT